MRDFLPFVFAVLLGPPVAVSAFQQWMKIHPHIGAIDEATAEKQIADDPSICVLDGFPADRSKAMARAQCWIDKIKASAGKSPTDIEEAFMTARRAVAERYVVGAVTAIQAAEEFEAKKIELNNIQQQRLLALSNAYSNNLSARAAMVGSLRPTASSVTCSSFGITTHCDSY